jgi:hypothetical protein
MLTEFQKTLLSTRVTAVNNMELLILGSLSAGGKNRQQTNKPNEKQINLMGSSFLGQRCRDGLFEKVVTFSL